ncbi:hypothetical protein JKP88DRAFT_333954 [Tribonema minus]|uniref:Uncharacterized protein n=1 Tax=Tribonema minus TaxID=303371 RepID=A0A835YKG2_9STRA|nr:hypothetical protein JKP88DRAFT_333954 [Tribonema minus]
MPLELHFGNGAVDSSDRGGSSGGDSSGTGGGSSNGSGGGGNGGGGGDGGNRNSAGSGNGGRGSGEGDGGNSSSQGDRRAAGAAFGGAAVTGLGAVATWLIYGKAPDPPETQEQRVARLVKALEESKVGVVNEAAQGKAFIHRAGVEQALAPPNFRTKAVPPATLLIIGARGAGKSTAAISAFQGQKGVVRTLLTGDSTTSVDQDEIIQNAWATGVLDTIGMSRLPQGEDPLGVLRLALQHIKDSGRAKHTKESGSAERPLFVLDADAHFSAAALSSLLRLCKQLGANTSLAQFVVVVSSAHTAAGVPGDLAELRVTVVEVGDLEVEEARQYITTAIGEWRKAHPDVAMGQQEQEQLVSDVISTCGTRVLFLEQLCRGKWGRFSAVSDLRKAADAFAAERQKAAVSGLAYFVKKAAKQEPAASRAQQLLLLRQLGSSSDAAVPEMVAAAAFGVFDTDFRSINLECPTHPFTVNPGSREVRAASVFARQAMLQQAAAWEAEELRCWQRLRR